MTRNEKVVIMDAIAALNDIRQMSDVDSDVAYSAGYTARRLQRLIDDFDDYIESLKRKEDNKNA